MFLSICLDSQTIGKISPYGDRRTLEPPFPLLLSQQFHADFADGGWGDTKIGGDFLQGEAHHDAGAALQEFFVAGGGIGAVEVEETGIGLYEQVF